MNGVEAETENFKKSVAQQVQSYLTLGFPARAQQFIDVLADFYQVTLPLTHDQFCFDDTAIKLLFELEETSHV